MLHLTISVPGRSQCMAALWGLLGMVAAMQSARPLEPYLEDSQENVPGISSVLLQQPALAEEPALMQDSTVMQQSLAQLITHHSLHGRKGAKIG